MYSRNIRTAAAVACLATLSACQARIDTHGFMPNPELIAQVNPGVSKREEIATILGTPSAPSTFDDNVWYYITQNTSNFAFFRPEIIDQQILVIEFDDNDIVDNVRKIGLEEAYLVEPTERTTPTAGKKLSILQQFFSNIGRFGNKGGVGGIGQGSPTR